MWLCMYGCVCVCARVFLPLEYHRDDRAPPHHYYHHHWHSSLTPPFSSPLLSSPSHTHPAPFAISITRVFSLYCLPVCGDLDENNIPHTNAIASLPHTVSQCVRSCCFTVPLFPPAFFASSASHSTTHRRHCHPVAKHPPPPPPPPVTGTFFHLPLRSSTLGGWFHGYQQLDGQGWVVEWSPSAPPAKGSAASTLSKKTRTHARTQSRTQLSPLLHGTRIQTHTPGEGSQRRRAGWQLRSK